MTKSKETFNPRKPVKQVGRVCARFGLALALFAAGLPARADALQGAAGNAGDMSPACATASACKPIRALQVLHWWTSSSERKAANALIAKLADDNIEWRDAAIPGGAGVGALKVLKSRVLAGSAPEVTQLIGASIREWADLGLLLELDGVAATHNWDKLLFPTVWSLVQHRNHVFAAPLGIHRINTLFYNRKLFGKLGIAAPKTWAEFERAATKLKQAGITPLAQSSEAWQVATLFETLLLAESGPAYYRELLVQKNPKAFADPRLQHALKRLRDLKQWMPSPLKERPWTEIAQQFANGDAAMFIMGDWVKGELNAWGYATDDLFACTAAPDTAQYHLYSVDTLAMLARDYSHQATQEKMAQVLMSATAQNEYNQNKGSIPVWRAADLSRMDGCARDSVQAFARGSASQAPSLVHRMAADETTKDAIIAEVHRYFSDDRISAQEAQQRLGAIVRAVSRNPKAVEKE